MTCESDVEDQTCCETGTESFGSYQDSRVTIKGGNPDFFFLYSFNMHMHRSKYVRLLTVNASHEMREV